MNTATNALHSLRGQQLKELVKARATIRHTDRPALDHWAALCGAEYDTRNLSDKSLEELDTLSGKYFYRVR